MLLSQRVAHERLARICFNDYDREIALVVEWEDQNSSERYILGIGRLSKRHGLDEASFTMLVSDEYQGQGIGKELLRRLIQIARDEKVKHLRATLSPDNASMRKVCEKLGFSSFYTNSKTGMVEAEMQL